MSSTRAAKKKKEASKKGTFQLFGFGFVQIDFTLKFFGGSFHRIQDNSRRSQNIELTFFWSINKICKKKIQEFPVLIILKKLKI